MNTAKIGHTAFAVTAAAMAAMIAASAPAHAAPSPGYHLASKVPLGGLDSWDYSGVDSPTHRIFLPRHTHTMVMDADGKVLGDIPHATGWDHAVAFAPDLNRGYLSDAFGSMTIFDLTSLRILQSVPIANRHPDDLLYDPASKRVFIFDNEPDTVRAAPGAAHPSVTGGDDVLAFDAATGKSLGSLQLDGKLEGGQTDNAGHIYVEVETKSAVVSFDAKTLKILARWPTAPCEEPGGQLAMDVAHHRLFLGCHNMMMAMMSTDTGKIVATVPIGAGEDATKYDPGTGLAFVASDHDGTITVVHEDTPDAFSVVQTIKTEKGAVGGSRLTLDTGNHNLYMMTGKAGPRPRPTPQNPVPERLHLPNTSMLWIFAK